MPAAAHCRDDPFAPSLDRIAHPNVTRAYHSFRRTFVRTSVTGCLMDHGPAVETHTHTHKQARARALGRRFALRATERAWGSLCSSHLSFGGQWHGLCLVLASGVTLDYDRALCSPARLLSCLSG